MRITVVDPDFDGKSVKRTWKTCFGIMISIDTGEFSNSLGCYVYEADLVGNSVLP